MGKDHGYSGKKDRVNNSLKIRPDLFLAGQDMQGFACVILRGKDRLDDNTDALHAALVLRV